MTEPFPHYESPPLISPLPTCNDKPVSNNPHFKYQQTHRQHRVWHTDVDARIVTNIQTEPYCARIGSVPVVPSATPFITIPHDLLPERLDNFQLDTSSKVGSKAAHLYYLKRRWHLSATSGNLAVQPTPTIRIWTNHIHSSETSMEATEAEHCPKAQLWLPSRQDDDLSHYS